MAGRRVVARAEIRRVRDRGKRNDDDGPRIKVVREGKVKARAKESFGGGAAF